MILTLAVLLLSGVFLSKGFTIVLRRFHNPDADKNDILKRLMTTSWVYLGLMLHHVMVDGTKADVLVNEYL